MPETASAMQSEVKNLETEMAVGHGNINSDSADGKRYVSERGPFSIQANHQMKPTIPVGTFEGKKHVAENWDISRLLDDCDNKEKICEMLGEMLELAASGSSEHRLQMQEGENGMRLAHVWFGPNFHLFRHSHPLRGLHLLRRCWRTHNGQKKTEGRVYYFCTE